MTPLEGAKSATAKGWCVFPLQNGGKRPFKDFSWPALSSADPAQVDAWATDYPGCNWGLDCGKSGLAVLDVDQGDSKAGAESLAGLELGYGDLPATLTVRTPSGGQHRYFSGSIKTGASHIGQHLDTRSVGGYVVLPGSAVEGRPYVVTEKAPVVPVPDWLAELAGKPSERQADATPVIDLDQPANVASALLYLQNAPPAVEGDAGDITTFKTAARLRDMGVSEPVALDLMLMAYNPRCAPEWDADELARKVANAYVYANLTAPGGATAEAAFQAVDEPEKVKAELEEKPDTPFAVRASSIVPAAIPRRAWVLGRRLISGFTTVTVAPGGAGKSTLTMLELLAIATGKPLTGAEVHRRGAVWVYNAEDPLDELERRMAAACQLHGIDLATLDNVFLTSGQDNPLVLVKDLGAGPIIIGAVVRKIVQFITDNNIVAFSLDPFVRLHRVNENDNMAIDLVVQAITQIIRQTGAAASVVHHTRKKGPNGSNGDMDSARGASALVSAARIAHTLGNMTEADAEKWGVPKDKASWYVRLDDAKANLSAPAEGVAWFSRESVSLPSGDSVGAIQPATLKQSAGPGLKAAPEIYEAVARFVQVGERKTVSAVASAILKDADVRFVLPDLPGHRALSRQLMTRYFVSSVVLDGVEYVFEEAPGDGRDKNFIRADYAGEE